MRPVAELEDILNDRGWFNDATPTALRRQAKSVDASFHLLEDILFGVEENQHTVAPIHGNTGLGKSRTMQKIASMERRLKHHLKRDLIDWEKQAKVFITWSPVQSTAKAQLGVLADWDSMIQDEYRSRNVGKGSATADAGFRTLTETLRANQNSFFTCSVHNKGLSPHFSLKALGWKEELNVRGRGPLTNVNIGLLYGPEFNLPMGYVFLDEKMWTLDPYIVKKYDQAKSDYNKMVKAYGGTPPEHDPDVLEYVTQEFLKHLEENRKEDRFELTKGELESIYMTDTKLPAVFFMSTVLSKVHAELKKQKRAHESRSLQERAQAIEERDQEQEDLIDKIAPKLVRYALRHSDDSLSFPKMSVCKDWLRELDIFTSEKIMRKCIDRAHRLWHEMKFGSGALQEAEEVTQLPPAIEPADFDMSPTSWIKTAQERHPIFLNGADWDYWGAYSKYLVSEKGWESQDKVVKKTGKSKGAVHSAFKKMAGLIKRIMGYEFERTMAKLYTSPKFIEAGVLRMIPPDDRVAKEGEPDRKVQLIDGSIRICSWKAHSENRSIKVKDSPEWKLTRELLEKVRNAYMVLEGLFDGRFFSIIVDVHQKRASVTIKNSDFLEWPPDPQTLFPQIDRPTDERLESSPKGRGVHTETETASSMRVESGDQDGLEPPTGAVDVDQEIHGHDLPPGTLESRDDDVESENEGTLVEKAEVTE